MNKIKTIIQTQKPALPLKILASIYKCIQKSRTILYRLGVLKTYSLPAKVICVGNLTVGGTGKTPAVIQLSKLLQQSGSKVAVLSRGYKRTSKGQFLIVSSGEGPVVSWREAGDEPYLLANELNAPIIVGKKRYLSGKRAIEKFKPDILLLDDGYQHISLKRDINLLVINAANPFGNEHLLPAGVLREPLEAIKRADVVLLTKSDQAEQTSYLTQRIKGYNPCVPVFKSIHQPSALINLESRKNWGLDWLQGKQVATLSGIGDPASFTAILEKLGATVVKEGRYPDHHFYKPQDISQLKQEATVKSAEAVITTGKDALRLPRQQGGTDNHNIPVLFLKIELKIVDDQKGWQYFWENV